jgi:hypothetical protein
MVSPRVGAVLVALAAVCADVRADPGKATATFTVLTTTGVQTFDAVSENWHDRIFLLVDSKFAGEPFTFTATRLTSPTGEPVDLAVKQTLPPNASGAPAPSTIEVSLSAKLTSKGPYTGMIRIALGNFVQDLPIRINYSLADYLISDAPRISVGDFLPSGSSTKFSIAVDAPQTASVSVSPSLSQFRRMGTSSTDGDDVDLVATFHETKDAQALSAMSMVVEAGSHKRLYVDWPLLSAGVYQGILRLESPGRDPKNEKFTILVKDSGIAAGAVVLVGAFLAWIMKRLSTSRLPRLLIRQAAGTLLNRIATLRDHDGFDDVEVATLDPLQKRIEAIRTQAQSFSILGPNWATESREALAKEEAKISAFTVWVNVGRVLRSAQLPADKTADFEARLKSIAERLRASDALTSKDQDELNSLNADVAAAKHDGLSKKVGALRKVIIDEQKGNADVASPAAIEFRNALEAVDQADRQLALSNYDQFARAYDAARSSYLRGATRTVTDSISDSQTLDVSGLRKLQADLTQHILGGSASDPLKGYLDTFRRHGKPSVSAGSSQSAPPDPLDADVVPQLVPIPRESVHEDTAALELQTRAINWTIDLLSGVVAAALGVLMIWSKSDTWGLPIDYLSAFLWGMGLYQLSSGSFQGIIGIRSALTSA